MDITVRRSREDRCLEADTDHYGLFVRLRGKARRDYRTVKAAMSEAFGAPASNPRVIDELVRVYLAQANGAK